MNPRYFGDSYDLVKRFICGELSALGYSVTIDPMFTGDWSGIEGDFYRLVGIPSGALGQPDTGPGALFLDPDTGVNRRGGLSHVSYERIATEAVSYEIVVSFDQAFSRQAKTSDVMTEKLDAIRELGCHGMFYDSHARFLFVSKDKSPLRKLRSHLVSLGLPPSRLVGIDV